MVRQDENPASEEKPPFIPPEETYAPGPDLLEVIKETVKEQSPKLIKKEVKNQSPKLIKKEVGKQSPELIEKEIKKESQKLQIRYTEALGIFVALFTFVSVSIQVFDNVYSTRMAILFITLIAICLSTFVYFLHFVLELSYKEKPIKSYILFGLSIVASVVIVVFFLFPTIDQESYQASEIKKLFNRVEILEKTNIPPEYRRDL